MRPSTLLTQHRTYMTASPWRRYLRERNRDASGVDLQRQMAYCSQLPPFWRNLYAGLFGLILLVTVLVRPGSASP